MVKDKTYTLSRTVKVIEKIDNTENPALSLSEAIEKLKELSDKNANI